MSHGQPGLCLSSVCRYTKLWNSTFVTFCTAFRNIKRSESLGGVLKRILICIACIAAASEAALASGIISCSGVANSSNSCDTSHLSTFNLQLNWDTVLSTSPTTYNAPPIDGSNYNTTWYGSAGFVNVTITGTSLIRGDDYALIDTTQGWKTPPPGLTPYMVTGTFDSAPDTGFTTSGVGLAVGPYGEGLLGSYNAGSFVIGSNAVLSTFGFRISSITDANFNVTINLFSSSDGSGTPLQTLTANGLGGGGVCSSLGNTSGPVPCNTAPFLFVNTTGSVRSFSIQTNDPTGFYIDGLDLAEASPEPATLVITGAGLLTLAYCLRRKGAAGNRR